MSELFKRSTPKKSFAELSKMIHGFIKTGKSTLAAQMKVGTKEPLFIATEDGHHNLDVSVEMIYNWDSFKLLVSKIEKNKETVQKDFSCIVIDLASDLDRMCEEYACKSLNIKHISDAQWAKGYHTQSKEFQKEMSRLFAILPITFISHTKEKEVEIEGAKYDMYQPNLSTSTKEYLNGKVDCIGFIIPSSKKSPTPRITFKPSTAIMAGTRHAWMAKDFELSSSDMPASYAAIENEFINGLKK